MVIYDFLISQNFYMPDKQANICPLNTIYSAEPKSYHLYRLHLMQEHQFLTHPLF